MAQAYCFDPELRHEASFTTALRERFDLDAPPSWPEALRQAATANSPLHYVTRDPWVSTADPSLVEEARAATRLSYREARELSALRYPNLPPVELLEACAKAKLALKYVRYDDGAVGTLIDERGADDPSRPTCVASTTDLVLIDVQGTAAPAVSTVLASGIDVWFETQAPHGAGVAFAVRSKDVARMTTLLEALLADAIAAGQVEPLSVTRGVAMVTLVGESTARTANVSGRFFGALGTIGIDVKAIAQRASSRTIAALVAQEGLATAVRAVHAAFNLSAEEVNVLVLGKGVVGGELLRQIASERATLRERHGLNLRVVGLADRKGVVYDERGVDPATFQETLAKPTRGAAGVRQLLPRFAELPVPVLVDCTAEDGMESVYHTAFAAGVHVVAANKKPLCVASAQRDALFAAARAAHRAYRYETTVGASLPVIETLKNLLRTGDRVRKIEGSFSGTLGFLANELTRGVPLATAVRDAKARGYTEPHPRDDLSGADAARKALILARELGMQLEFESVAITPFVPEELLVHDDVEAFFAALVAWQATFAATVQEHAGRGEVLRYLASIDPQAGSASVRPTFVAQDHPSTRLRGTEGFVAFYTERYAEYPLVVQGAGAGGAVTAAGVLADVLALSQSLRGA